jgi:hypothetical protein
MFSWSPVLPVPPLQLLLVVAIVRSIINRTAEDVQHAAVDVTAGLYFQLTVKLFRVPALEVGDRKNPEGPEIGCRLRTDPRNGLQVREVSYR